MVYKPKKGNRWYDNHPDIYNSIEMLRELPPPLQRIVAQGVISFVMDNTLLGTPDELKSFGHHRVLGLIQSKAKRRWYDKDPILHKAINNILLMPDEARTESAFRLVISLESVEAYKEYCIQNGTLCDPEEVELIVSDIFGQDYEELTETVAQAGDNRSDIFLKRVINEEVADSSQVLDEDSGMKLSANMLNQADS